MSDHHPIGGRARTVASAALGLLAAAVAVSWAWNRLAADLGGLPEAGFIHGVAAVAAIAATAAVAAFTAGLTGRGARS